MTHKMRSTFVISASTRAGAAILGATIAAIISGGSAAAAEARGEPPSTTAEIMRQFIYSPWTKVCGSGQPLPVGRCFTGKAARTKDGRTVIAVSLIEVAGEPARGLRVTLPETVFDIAGERSVRITIDKESAIGSAVNCSSGLCWADYNATVELLDKLKKGRMLQIQAVSLAVPMIPFSLADSSGASFAGANEGPPTDPNAFQEMLKDLGFDPRSL
jgi:invasion protein IalB